jgi:putative PIN family toxin of toxin-antitoxin system
MVTRRIVLDTNVLVSALRSRRGASYKLLSLVGDRLFDVVISVPLVVEYEAAAKRHSRQLGLTHSDIDDIIDYLCQVGLRRDIFFLWRPILRDPKDDLVLEVAVESESDYLVTHNLKDFAGADRFGIRVVTPKEFLKVIGQAR